MKYILRLCFLCLLSVTALASDYGFRIVSADWADDQEDYRLNAKIDYRFSQAAIEALNSGVALTLALNIKIKRQRPYWFDETVFDEDRIFHIRYQPLAKQFTLILENNDTMHRYSSLNALLEAMGSIKNLKLLPRQNLSKGLYKASLSVGLDIESLPLPLRPIAYAMPQWYLDSPAYLWSFVN